MRARRAMVALSGLIGLVLAGGAGAAGQQVASAATSSALVLNYTFARPAGVVVTDHSSSGLDGVLVDASAPAAYVQGRPGHGKALTLVGARHQFVDVGDAPPLDVSTYTLAAWVRYTGVPNDQTLGRWEIMEKAGAYWMNIRTTGQIRAGGFYGGCASASWVYLDTPQPIPVDTWTHVASTYDKVRLTIWVNGVAVASRAVGGATCTNAEPLAVGAKNAPAKGLQEAFLDGSLDDVRVYGRALTATQIASLAK